MAGEANDADVEGEVFAAELGTDADVAGDFEEFGFEFGVTKGLTVFIALSGEGVEVFGGGEFYGFEAGFGAGAADDEDEVVGRAGGGAEGAHFFEAEFLEASGVEEGFGFLVKEGFVRGAAAFADEEEFVFVSGGGVEVDLGGEVGAGVNLIVHGAWGGLGVAEVFFGVGFVDAGGEVLGIVAVGPDVLAFFADDGGGAGVLAEGKDAVGGDFSIAEEHDGDHAVIFGGGWVVEDSGNLREVSGTETEVDGFEGFVGKEFEGLGGDFENGVSLEFGGGDVIG